MEVTNCNLHGGISKIETIINRETRIINPKTIQKTIQKNR